MVQTVFELGINLLETFITIDFITKYLGCKFSDKRKTIGFLIAWMIDFAEISIMNYLIVFETFEAYIPVIIYFTYAMICLKGTVWLKLWISVVAQIVLVAIAIVTNLGVCNIIGYDPDNVILVFNSIRIMTVIISKIILFYVTRIILKYRYKNPLDGQNLFTLIIIPIISIISLCSLMLAAMNHDEIKVYILVGMSGIVIANIITYYIFMRLNKDYESKLEIRLLKQQKENAEQNMQNTDAFVKQMKSARHDMKNQLIITGNYISSGKYTEAQEHIKALIEDYLPSIQDFINSGNDAFDAIVNAKIILCTQKKIFIEVKLFENSLKNISDIDIGILFGNLLDNAIEAAEKSHKKHILVDIYEQGAYLSILVSNSTDKQVLESNKNLETTKSDKEMHGIGIKNIKSIVNKYNGMLDFSENNNEFCCHIMLDISD